MDIKTLQLKFLDILKDRYTATESDDIYIKNLIVSKNLKILKDIIFFWRGNEIENYCYLTSTLLKKIGMFEEKVKEYYTTNNFSNYIEQLGKSFLMYLKNDSDELIKFAAEFELAMIEVKSGSDDEFFIETYYNPESVFNFIIADDRYPDICKEKFLVRVSKEIENNFSIIKLK